MSHPQGILSPTASLSISENFPRNCKQVLILFSHFPQRPCVSLGQSTSWTGSIHQAMTPLVEQRFAWKPVLTAQLSSAAESCPTLCDSTDRNTPGLPVHHQLPESTETHVHWVGDAIQPSHPLFFPCSCLLSFPELESFPMS